jgi:hypothetical protein
VLTGHWRIRRGAVGGFGRRVALIAVVSLLCVASLGVLGVGVSWSRAVRARGRSVPAQSKLAVSTGGVVSASSRRAERVASRMEFHGLSAAASRRLLTRDYGSVLAAVSANPAVSLARAGRVLRYLSDSRALVSGAHGLEVMTSTVPLQTGAPGGAKAPVDLDLAQSAAGFRPTRPLVNVLVAHRSTGGVEVGGSGVEIAPVGNSVEGTLSGASSVFFGGVARDTDAVVAPKLRGADLLSVLRSAESPTELRYRLRLPLGAVLRQEEDGAVVSQGTAILARIPAPVARDAQGALVPVGMRVRGDELLVNVADAQAAFPVLVDPEVVVADIFQHPSEWKYYSEGGGEHSLTEGGASISTSILDGGAADAEPEWFSGGGGLYEWPIPETLGEVTSVEFSGVKSSVGGGSTSGGEVWPSFEGGTLLDACHTKYRETDRSGVTTGAFPSSIKIYNSTREPFECDKNPV